MFWKKKETVSVWNDPDAVKIHYIQKKALINEYQHNLGMCSNGEYLSVLRDINAYLDKLESKPAVEPVEMFND